MSIIFPASNLATASQPWAREVQKQLSNLITSSNSERINNVARDNQLNSSILALSGVVADVSVVAQDAAQAAADANDAINGLIGLGSSGSSYTINASNINAGTITGIVIQSASSGQRVVVNSSQLDFYNSSGNLAGRLYGGGGQGVIIESTDANTTVSVVNAEAAMYQIGGGYFGANSGGVIIGANNKVTFMQDSNIQMPFLATSTAAANTRWGTTTNGRLFYISSARRAKYDIQDAAVNLEALNLRPRTWFDMNEYIENGESTEGLVRIPGFVAEEVLEAGLEEFVTYDAEGTIQGLSYDRMVAAIIPVIKYLNEQIEELKNEITILKGA